MAKREPKTKGEAMIFTNAAGSITIMQRGKPPMTCSQAEFSERFPQKDTLLFVKEYKLKPSNQAD